MAFIYVIKNDINNNLYVGKTSNTLEQRWKEHLKDYKRRSCEKRPLYNAINKYGPQHFWIELLEECIDEKSSEREIYWINKLNTYHKGYNATKGGDGTVLYDYDVLFNKYLELKNVQETANFFNCDPFTITKACRVNGVNPSEVQKQIQKELHGKKIYAIKDGEKVACFNSLREGADWIKEQGISKATLNSIRINIGRVVRGVREKAYDFSWQEI